MSSFGVLNISKSHYPQSRKTTKEKKKMTKVLTTRKERTKRSRKKIIQICKLGRGKMEFIKIKKYLSSKEGIINCAKLSPTRVGPKTRMFGLSFMTLSGLPRLSILTMEP